MAVAGKTKTAGKAVKARAQKPPPDYSRSAQERFLGELAQDRRKVVIFLTNGIKLEGEIKSFDDYAILIEGAMTDHVYKHAVSTIQPLTEAVSKAKGGTRERAARNGAIRARADAAAGAADAQVVPRAEKPRQPVIVVRPKRRLVKTLAGED